MSDPFVHLHVASAYSLQYGTSQPDLLIERAAEYEMDHLALTDRDGAYGAIKFALAARRAGIRPVLGTDLAYRPILADSEPRPRARPGRAQPARGGAFRDLPIERGGPPRLTVLASADTDGGRAGWAALCRLISGVQLTGERGQPVLDLFDPALAEHLGGGNLMVMLGPGSDLAHEMSHRREDRARSVVARLREIIPSSHLVIEAASHLRSRGGVGGGAHRHGLAPGSTAHAARMLGLAEQLGVCSVLSNVVRYADRRDAVTADVLDAARRLVALDQRHIERTNAEGYLKSGKQMFEIAEDVCGPGDRDGPRRLLARTRGIAERCGLDGAADLGLGEVHFPEFEVSVGSTQHRTEAIRISHALASPDAGGYAPAPGDVLLRQRCEQAIGHRYGNHPRQVIWKRLDDELELIRYLGYASYFLAVGEVVELIGDLGIRCAARGSGAGSLVNYLLGVSGVEPIRHGLLMERFLSPLRRALPDIDLDVESDRRLEVYEAILDRYGAERCLSVSMMETYRVRHAIRDVGAALGMPPTEVDTIAKRFPHIRARDVRMALRDLPELRNAGLSEERMRLLFELVERLDGLPRHIAMHPCGVLLSDVSLLDRTPVEASYAGFPMSQFDKEDVEEIGLLKLDVLGIRMQSSMAHAVAEIDRTEGVQIDLDDAEQVPFDDPDTYRLISSAKTLGIFQIESPGQRELVGKSGIDTFTEIIADISLFRPGPVKSDMITPYLEAKQGWATATYAHPDLRPILESTHGVVVYHEQVIELLSQFTGITYAEADDKRRAMGDKQAILDVEKWFIPQALSRGYPEAVVNRMWEVIRAFAAFGFCKAHAAAFALPTFQSAWLKTHWPAHFLSGVLTHDPGMYPKRLILDDARHFGIEILGLDVNASQATYRVEPVNSELGYGIRIALGEVKGITEAEIGRITAARPFASLSDLWQRARVSRPVLERLVLTGGFDSVYGSAGGTTRRDLLLTIAELDRQERAAGSPTRTRSRRHRIPATGPDPAAPHRSGLWAQARAQSQATPTPEAPTSVQMALDLGDSPEGRPPAGLPEMTASESVAAELEILGLDVSGHVLTEYDQMLTELGVVRSKDLLGCRSKADIWVAGVKVATQTPPIRSGKRVVFLTLDDSTGPVDATFFDDAQGAFATTVFGSWLLVVTGEVRRTGPRGVSLRATGCWDLLDLHQRWRDEGVDAVHDYVHHSLADAAAARAAAGDPGPRRVLTHSNGFTMSPYADIAPAGDRPRDVARKLWHRSPGSPG